MKNKKTIWLVSTDHLEDNLWFKTDDDFKVGMNYVAVQVTQSGVIILAFILMSNHVHFILFGSREEVQAFITGFKMRYSRYLQRKYGLREFLRKNDVDITEISEEEDPESLERAIAYVQMNCVAANICAYPALYPWGSGGAFFNSIPAKGLLLKDLSGRAKRRILHCICDLPGDWMLHEDGYILPVSYLNVKYVENLFKTPRRMNFFLNNSSKAKKRIGQGEADLPSFRDQTILAVLPDLCRTLFGKTTFDELTDSEKSELLRQLRFRFSSHVNQLARVVGISYEAAAKLLDHI